MRMKKPELKKSGHEKFFPLFLCALLLMCMASESAAAGEMVLIRGNYWVSGIPGFGVNSFSALAGEYRLKSGADADFSVYLTREPIYFSAEWQIRPGTGDISVHQRTGETGYLAAAMLDDSPGSSWVAVLFFPKGLEGAGISGDAFNRMFRVLTGRILYFISLSRSPRELSLPAALEF
jgi:hypothetical protein